MTERLELDIDATGAARGARVYVGSVDDVIRKSREADTAVGGLDRRTRGLGQAMSLLKTAAAVAGIGSLSIVMNQATRTALDYETAMAEVRTLLNDDKDVRKYTEATRALAIQFGRSPILQTKALYQVISAGASDAAQAVDILTAANKLATAGVADLFVTTDGLTSVVNAYTGKVKDATEVSDAFFVAVRDGKTTVAELAAVIGKVAPTAVAANVSLNELLAGVAAITTGGVSTSSAVAGLNQVLVSVIKPTSDAEKTAKALGLQFDVAALKSKGLAGFLKDVQAKVGDNTAAMAKLFGSVEAIVPALALTGAQSEKFAAILKDMEGKAGATDKAFAKIAGTSETRLNIAFRKIGDEALSAGQQILTILVPAVVALANNLDAVAAVATALATGVLIRLLAPAFIAVYEAVKTFALGLAFAVPALGGWSTAAGAAAVATRSLTTALAVSPVGIIVAISALVVGMTAYGDATSRVIGLQQTFNSQMEKVKGLTNDANRAIGDRKEVLEKLRVQAVQAALAENKLALAMADTDIQAATRASARTGALGFLFPGVNAAAQGQIAKFLKDAVAAREELLKQRAILQGEAVGLSSGDIALRKANDSSGRKPVTTTTVDTTKKTVTDLAKIAEKELRRLDERLRDTATDLNKLNDPALAFKKRLEEIEQLRSFGLSDKAYEKELAKAYDELLRASDDWAAGATRAFRDYAKEATNAARQVEDVVRNTVTNLENAFVQFVTTGKVNFKDLVNSIIADLARLTIRQTITGPLSQALGSVFGNIFASGGGNTTAGLLPQPSAMGNVFDRGNVVPFAAGGVVDRTTYFPMNRGVGMMGEAGPEAILPLTRIAGKLGVYAAGLAGRSSGGNVTINVFTEDGNKVERREKSGPNGDREISLYIRRAVAEDIANDGIVSKAIRQRYTVSNRVGGR